MIVKNLVRQRVSACIATARMFSNRKNRHINRGGGEKGYKTLFMKEGVCHGSK